VFETRLTKDAAFPKGVREARDRDLREPDAERRDDPARRRAALRAEVEAVQASGATPQGIDAARVTEWYAANLPDVAPPRGTGACCAGRRWARVSSTANVDYFRAFQYWRLAAIVEGVLARYLKNVMGKQADTGAFRAQVDGLVAQAQAAVRRFGA
jgi:hypothetical protein